MPIEFSALSDRLNPVLVKEVRQATRSRAFTMVLLIGLGIACLLSAGALMEAASQGVRASGEVLLMSLATSYTWLIRIYVILSAFQSTAEEFTEDTIDQLLLSSLSPWKIALGKFQASLVLILLLLSSFLPFAAVTFLMDGVGLKQLVVFLGLPTIHGISLVALAVLAGSLARNKGLRILLVSILVMGAGAAGFSAIVLSSSTWLGGLNSRGMLAAAGLAAVGAIGHVVLLLAFASAALTPAAENRSTIPRRAFSFWVVSALLVIVITESLRVSGFPSSSDAELRIFFMQTLPVFALFLTERHGLPRSAKPLAKGKPFRRLRNLWLPGGERAVGYLFVHLAALALLVMALTQTSLITSNDWLRGSRCFSVVALGWVLLPVTILSKITAHSARGRAASLVLLVALWVFAPMSRAAFGFMTGQGSSGLEDSLNPFWLLTNSNRGVDPGDYRVSVVLAAMAIALQLVLLLRRLSKSES